MNEQSITECDCFNTLQRQIQETYYGQKWNSLDKYSQFLHSGGFGKILGMLINFPCLLSPCSQLDNNNFSDAEIPVSYGNLTKLVKL